MEPNTSAESIDTDFEDKPDNYEHKLDNDSFSDGFFGLDLEKEKPVDNATIVIFSLDMTDNMGYTNGNEICKIAAACRGNNGIINRFQVYLKPENYGIAPSITLSKGYKIGMDGNLLLDEVEVDAQPQREGLEMFLNFLSDQSGGTRSILLAAHKFRDPYLLRHMAEYNLLPACKNLILGFIDIRKTIKTRIYELHNRDAKGRALWVTTLSRKYLGLKILRERADVTVDTVLDLINHFDCTNEMLRDSATLFNFDVYIVLMDLIRNFPPAQIDLALTRVPIRTNVQDQIPVKTLNEIAVAEITTDKLLQEYIVRSDVKNMLLKKRIETTPVIIRRINDRLSTMINAN